jgi:Heparinase II/III N-terminus/Heparinase II/III-like protein
MMCSLLAAACFYATASTQNVTSAEDVCRVYPERVQGLFAALDLDRDGLEAVKAAVGDEDWPVACTALLEYYRTGLSASWLRKPVPKPGTGRVAAADAILNDTFTNYTVTAQVPRRPDGGLDWSYNGPDGDKEWGWGLNRHPWGNTLLGAYEETGNAIYVEAFDRMIHDWIVSSPYPGKKSSTPQWRGLEAFMRIHGCWSKGFYALQEVEALVPATRILMLSSIPEHAHYARNFHAGGGNWIAMELLGLATAAVCWPEFKDAGSWYDYAVTRMMPEVTKQVYPDGVQKELTSHYHRVSLHSFDRFITLAHHAGRELPTEFTDGVARMYNYVAYSMRPSGYGPLNNDSNLDFTRSEVLAAAERLNRPDWTYIATNGTEGTPSEGPPSVVFPWAGQVVMRSGWDADAHWAFFDVGPLGIGHWHYDKLHLSVLAYGRDVLVDGGRYTYVGGPWRSYFVGSRSHNVILVDGKGQREYQRAATEPMAGNFAITPEYDYARGTYDGGYGDIEGEAVHTRAVVYRRGEHWVVVDRVTTDRPRTIQALWHFHPDCAVAAEGADVLSTDEGKGNVRVTPVSGLPWEVDLVKGRGEPDIQGWWSRIYNEKTPSTCAVYTARVDGAATFAWIVTPGKGAVPPLTEAALVSATDSDVAVRIRGDAGARTITVPLSGGTALRIADEG